LPFSIVVTDVSLNVFLVFGTVKMCFPDFFVGDDSSSIISSSSSFELSALAKKKF
jgi:hypothetical protein